MSKSDGACGSYMPSPRDVSILLCSVAVDGKEIVETSCTCVRFKVEKGVPVFSPTAFSEDKGALLVNERTHSLWTQALRRYVP
jgi:hypothetical protein